MEMCCGYILLFLLGLAGYAYHKYVKRCARREHLEKMIARRQREREESIEMAKRVSSKIDSVLRDRIASWNFEQLRDELQRGTITAVQAVQTYFHQGVIAQEKTNCATLFMKEAERWAEEWDEKAKDPSFKKPAFFGIPISVKECVPVKGYDVTRGFAQDLFKPCENDSILITHVKKLGCIPFVETNVPQSLLTYNSCNPIYGATNHVLDKTRTTGGSSGGESAILSAEGSILGIGGDVGGSIRIPCHFTGMAGIKPSHLRFAHRGVTGAVPGRPLINANDGPMCRDVKTNVEFLRQVWGDSFQSDQDPYCPPVKFNESLYEEGRKYKIGYYVDDGWFTPVPAVQRAVLEAKEILEKAGHTVVPFRPPNVAQMFKMYIRALCVDGGQFVLNKLLTDIMEPTLYTQAMIYAIPIWIQRLIAIPIRFVFPRLANVMEAMTLSTLELREAYAEIESYRDAFVGQMMNDGVDAILCPPQVMVAPPHASPCKLFSAVTYTCIFNLLDFGAGVVNVTKVKPEDEDKLENEYPQTDAWYKEAKRACKDTVGFPVNVQVAAAPYREEIVLRILRDIEISVTGK
ncbi:unnamed protein product [Auanema sp. JU1783]|nr:unnamed protein product [Auanema sp. JU1783]